MDFFFVTIRCFVYNRPLYRLSVFVPSDFVAQLELDCFVVLSQPQGVTSATAAKYFGAFRLDHDREAWSRKVYVHALPYQESARGAVNTQKT
jgi:hypothetical protein